MKTLKPLLKLTKIHVLVLFSFLISSFIGFSETKTSVANGNWTSPGTWDPWGLPANADTIIIQTDVQFGDGLIAGLNATYIEIKPGASLTQNTVPGNILFVAEEVIINGDFIASNAVFPGSCHVGGKAIIYGHATFGEELTNEGETFVYNFLTIGESCTNDGFIYVHDYFTVGSQLTNRGEIHVVQYATIGGVLSNSATFNVQNYLTCGYLFNYANGSVKIKGYGVVSGHSNNYGEINSDTLLIFSDSLLNDGVVYSKGDIYVLGKTLNEGSISGKSVTVHQGINNSIIKTTENFYIIDSTYFYQNTFENNELIQCEGNMYADGNLVNNMGILVYGTADIHYLFYNSVDGYFQIGDTLIVQDTIENWNEVNCGHLLNQGLVTGTGGSYCIQDSYVNNGAVNGSIDVCDGTPSGSNDMNNGTVSGSVTSCISSPCYDFGLGTDEESIEVSIYPNPVNTKFNLQISEYDNYTFTLYNAAGQVVIVEGINAQNTTFNRDDLPAGIYYYSLVNEEKSTNGKIIFE